ncbi:MAG: HAMP domain-containing histidine kinase [Candidatus Heimdallarchaeota archaeon]|nr:HAMP domain-containing histidine kinase [Candidatus Heimdallarchaeota archaeon]
MPENLLSSLKDQEIVTFEEIKRLTKLVFIPAGYIVQLKNLANVILWEDPKTVELRGDMIGQKCYHVNFGRETPCPLCTAFDSIEKMTPQIKEDRSIIDGKWYRVVAIPIIFNDKIAAIELIQEITSEKLKGQIYDSVLSIDSAILNITRHDIPNYLHTVNMALEGMLSSKTEIDNKQLLEIAYTNTTRAIQILGDLRELSKLEHPFDDLRPVNVAQILNQVQKDVVSHYPDKEINITIQSGISLDKSVIIASELLSEVFMNIFTNSIKFTSENEVIIDITIDKIIRDQEFINVKITDFGQGIPPEVKNFLFDRANLIKNGWKPTKKSTGLGMTIIKSLVDFFGGDISYQNRVEDDWTKGTTVTLLFPLAAQSIFD